MVACSSGPAFAQKPNPKDDAYEVLYPRYLQAARQMSQESLSSIRWMANLGSDFRARDVNDLVTVRVIESIVAAGSADTALDKNGKASASLTNFFGLENKLPDWIDPTALVNTASSTDFKGGGSTTRRGELTAVVTARVVEVLPNGDLVLEGVREIDINGDRQVVVLTGWCARPTAAGQLGGVDACRPVADPLLRPGPDQGQPEARMAHPCAQQDLLT